MSDSRPAAPAPPSLRLVRPQAVHLAAYRAALERGYSPDNVRGAAAALEQLAEIARDPQAFLAHMDDPEAKGPPVTMPDGSTRPRIPGLRRWMWLGPDDARGDEGSEVGFVGSVGLRWTADGSPLPPHVLGHIGYAVVPWHQRRGHATRALALALELAAARGLAEVEITTDPDNIASQRVIEANGGRLVERFDKGAVYGHAEGLRYIVKLGDSTMLEGTCHCGAVRLRIPHRPREITNCNCSICRRLGALWAYYDVGTVAIDGHPGNTTAYIQGDRTLRTVRCRTCGCTTHWEPLDPVKHPRMGVNIRNFDPHAIGDVRIRLFDGADTWRATTWEELQRPRRAAPPRRKVRKVRKAREAPAR